MFATDPLAARHLVLHVRVVLRHLREGVARQAARAARLDRPDLAAGVCITDQHVLNVLDDLDQFLQVADGRPGDGWTIEERDEEERLRRDAAAISAKLPLDRLAEHAALSAWECSVLALCAAAEIHRGFEGVFAYVMDDARRPFPTIDLACALDDAPLAVQMDRRLMLGRFGRLRRYGLLEAFAEGTTELRTSLRLGAGVRDHLSGAGFQTMTWHDPDEVAQPARGTLLDWTGGALQRLGRALASRRADLVGLWGASSEMAEEAALAVALAAGKKLRRLPLEAGTTLHERLLTAAALGEALLLLVPASPGPEVAASLTHLSSPLARVPVPCILAGVEPWRPTHLLAQRNYLELLVPAPGLTARRERWRRQAPEIDDSCLNGVADRYPLSALEMQAASRLARLQAAVESNGIPVRTEDRLDMACAAITRKQANRVLNLVQPQRGPEDLVLAPELHRQVLEIAGFTQALPRVAESWGFRRRVTGSVGIKALFTGDPGTGKTLATEVIASILGVPLLKINIGQAVSKWIGETSKNLDEAFDEALASHAVLFIDEADALCGRRGDVRHGSDRYANIEVSHLLQRLEEHDGLVILASNLKENIDPAFLRRFHVVLTFPRPAEKERQLLWQRAFPTQAPLDREVNLHQLARLDMTGAGIVSAARTAALIASDRGLGSIGIAQVVQGIARQYRREGRMLTRGDLGPHADLLQEA